MFYINNLVIFVCSIDSEIYYKKIYYGIWFLYRYNYNDCIYYIVGSIFLVIKFK